MDSIVLQNLSEEQRKPAEVVCGPVLVTAGAGSGKTRMLTHRIAHLVYDLNVNPWNILAITFTNKAANEMKSRLSDMIANVDDMWVCTFHSMCSRILRRDIDKIGYTKNFSIYTDVEKTRVVKRLLEQKNTNITVDTIMWHISNAKNHLLTPSEYAEKIADKHKREIIISVFEEYEKELKRCNSLDFDDLLNTTYKLLNEVPEVLEYYQNKFQYIHVDEFQDTNQSQYELIKLLSSKNNNVFVVGDEDQCIYSWRGANAANVIAFVKDYKDVQVFKLEQNYRSTKKILALANRIIKNNENRLEKTLWTNNDDGVKVEQFSTYNENDEAEYVASTIKSLVDYAGYSYNDFAILMRVNALSRIFEEKMIMYGIPYKVYGGYKFFERKEIKDIVSYLKLIHNPYDDDATRRMLAFPKKGIGDATIAQIALCAEANETSMFNCIMENLVMGSAGKKLDQVRELMTDLKNTSERMPLYEFCEYLVKKVDFKNAIGDKTDEDANKQMNIDDFLLSAKEFTEANEGATLEDYLGSITLMRDVDSLDDNDNNANLFTIHAAKGLEFKVVFIVGLNDGLFPLNRAINSADPNELEEERRLMYVAITRAKERLYLTRSRTKFSVDHKSREYTVQSRFLSELFDDKYKAKKESVESSPSEAIYSRPTKITANVSQVNKKDYSLYKVGTKVKHQHFGVGEITVGVTDFTGGFVTIKFESVGLKTLSLKFANLEIIE